MDAKLFVHVCMCMCVCLFVVWFTEQPRPCIGYAGEKAVLICKAQAEEIITYLWLTSKIQDRNFVPVDKNCRPPHSSNFVCSKITVYPCM